MKKTLWVCLFVLCLMFWTAAAPDTAELDLSQGSITVSGGTAQQNGFSVTASRFRIVQSGGKTANTVSVTGGKTELVLGGLNVESTEAPLSVASGAELSAILEGENSLWSTGSAGIRVPAGAKLTLSGEGTLLAVGRNHSAGIGGGFREEGGAITITGGTVTGTGAGAGIGGGTGCKADITITGGTVTANGGGLSAGLGGGYGDTKVTITGGTVNARGASNGSDGGGAGIGNGNYGSGAVITITGGTVTAKGGPGGGAGIGGGDHGAAGSVRISGATVTATGGGLSSGIGGGARTSYDPTGGEISIENSTVTVTGYYSAIGGGSAQNAHGCASILIKNSTMIPTCKDTSGVTYNEKLQNPAITGPLQHSVAEGLPTRLQVTAGAPSGFTCSWQISPTGTGNWEDLPGTAAISEFSITGEQSGKYFRCLLTNAYGSTAWAGPIRIYTLSYSLLPTSVRTELNTSVTLTAASDSPSITWQWERSTDFGQTYTLMSGETGSSLTVSVTPEQSDAFYRCAIIGSNGDALYAPAVRVCTASAACYYREIVYMQELDGSYTVWREEQIEAAAGIRVSCKEVSRKGFTRNIALGQSLGTVRENCSLVLTSYYDRKIATISFEAGGAAYPDAITAMYGAPVTLPAPETVGGVFGGWFTDEARTNPAEIPTMPAQDTVLYALWLVDEAGRGLEYRIGGILLIPDHPEETATVPAGSFTARIFVTNLSSLCADHIILTVHDKDGRQLELYWETIRTDMGETAEISIRVENKNGSASTVTAYILSSGSSMKPLTQRAIFGSQPLPPQ